MTALPTTLTLRPPAQAPAALNLAALVGAEGWARLPAAVQRRFAAAHADTFYAGTMDLRCSRIGRVYAWLSRAFGGPLTSIAEDEVPTVVRVRGDGRGGVVWERSFARGVAGSRVVRSTKEIDGAGLRERTDGGLSMALEVFEDSGSLVFESRSYALVLGRLAIPVPAWLAPGTCRVTHTDLGHRLFRFTLSMRHPLWGETFHQSGVFADPCEE
ncbi:MAG: DUF4166 domain-containing protein [Aquabacterium sp.]|nr:MAG: DUF4166 domain-containing protein [Aquabacterium sp.]